MEKFTLIEKNEVLQNVQALKGEAYHTLIGGLDADGQIYRFAERFVTVAVAGLMASGFGVLPYENQQIMSSIKTVFDSWLKERGSTKSLEELTSVERVREFIIQHANSRFSVLKKSLLSEDDSEEAYPDDKVLFNRVGWKFLNSEGVWEYYISPEVFRSEICKGLNYKKVHKVLLEMGMLKPDSKGKATCPIDIPTHPKMRVYHLLSKILEDKI